MATRRRIRAATLDELEAASDRPGLSSSYLHTLQSPLLRDPPLIASAGSFDDMVFDRPTALTGATSAVRSMLTEIEDRRFTTTPRRLSTRRARFRLASRSRSRSAQARLSQLYFDASPNVLICVRRRRRREALFARARGRRPRAFRRPRRGPFSNVWC